jgi:hypothetical protein
MKTIIFNKNSIINFKGAIGVKGNFTPLQSFLDVKKFMEDYKVERCHLVIGNFEIDIIKDMSPERFWQIFTGFTKHNSLVKEKIIDFSEL